jgi:Na+/H+ antiporter NhaD/arsenite permease-like protein
MAPVTLAVCKRLDINPVSFLMCEALASNIGGTATLVGDPPNIMIASKAHLGYLDFLVVLGPIVLVILMAFAGGMWLVYGRRMTVSDELQQAVLVLRARDAIRDSRLLWQCLGLLALVNLGFALHGLVHLEPATVALLGASLFMLIGRKRGQSPEVDDLAYLSEVEWKTIFFFIGLFIVVGGLVKVGAIKFVAHQLVSVTQGHLAATTMTVLWGSAFLSAAVDNIPYVAAMNPLIVDLARSLHPEIHNYSALVHHPDIIPLWWALALGACLGGNGTLIGASANVVIADCAGRAGYRISFWQFIKLGFPIMLGSIALSSLYLWVVFLR